MGLIISSLTFMAASLSTSSSTTFAMITIITPASSDPSSTFSPPPVGGEWGEQRIWNCFKDHKGVLHQTSLAYHQSYHHCCINVHLSIEMASNASAPSTGGPPVYLGLHQTSLSDEMVLHTTLSREVHQGEEKLCSAVQQTSLGRERVTHLPLDGEVATSLFEGADIPIYPNQYQYTLPMWKWNGQLKGRTVKRRYCISCLQVARGVVCSEIRIGMLGSGASDIDGEGGGLCCRCSCQGGKKGKYPGLKLWRKMSECSGRAVAGWGGWMTGTGKVFKCFEILLREEPPIIGRLLSGQTPPRYLLVYVSKGESWLESPLKFATP